jgi:glycerol-3-phosphate dehydrogenase
MPTVVDRAARAAALASFAARPFDVLVIGGGITGCGIARDAVRRGLTVALVEKDDFASGTSSRSSRLVHGGVRYLEHGYLHLVFESSAERRRLLRLAPHLVRPLAFTWPVYVGARIPRWKLSAGLTLYDALALFRNVGRHHRLGRADVLAAEPALRADGLVGGAQYFDAATNDARLTLANALDAAAQGAAVVNHASAEALLVEQGRAVGATIRDALTGERTTVRARVVVNASGPWSDAVRALGGDLLANHAGTRGSKGVHIAVPRDRVGNNAALTLLHPTDGRVFFVLPAGPHAIIGTTDTYTDASADFVHATRDDVRYLVDAANRFFPDAALDDGDVVSAWAGIRPLLPSADDNPGGATREHAVTTSPTGLVSITGGKLTTYRIMARDVVDLVTTQLGRRAAVSTKSAPLPGGDFTSFDALIADAVRATSDIPLAEHLVSSFGTRWPAVWSAITSASERVPIVEGLPYTIGELRYCVEQEMAMTVGDLLIRRTQLAFQTRDHGASAAEYVAPRVADLLGWDSGAVRRAVDAYVEEARRMFEVG